MTLLRLGALATLGLLLPACSSSGGDEAGGQMFLESCSLGCGSGSTGTPVNCQTVNVAQNMVVSMVFSKPVDQGSLGSGTFLLINAVSGSVPAVSLTVDPGNPRRVIARPQISFDDQNNPVYQLAADTTYDLIVRGAGTGGNGPFIRSLDGKNNQTALSCTVFTNQGIKDAVPGPPIATAFVEVDDGMGGTTPDVPADGATDVALDSVVTIVFEDIMNPATLSNPTTRTSPFVTTKVDPDGNVSDPTDQVEIAGFYDTVVDFDNLRTILTFEPEAGFFSAGPDPFNPRKTVMNLPAGIEDLTGKALANPGQIVFATVPQSLDPIVLPQDGGEPFTDTDNQDPDESGATWGSGRLTYGIGGGAGRLGELVVASGTTVVLNTDSQVFPLATQFDNLLTNAEPGVDYNPTVPGTWPEITVTSGDFDFSRLVIESNATLVLEGSQPGRVFSRGDLVINGVVDCSGETPDPHISNTWRKWDSDGVGGVDPPNDLDFEAAYGGPGGSGGPNAGGGGQGADRYFTAPAPPPGSTRILNAGSINYHDELLVTNVGRRGSGIAMLGTLAAGVGGVAWPTDIPGDSLLPSANSDWGDTSNLSFSNTFDETGNCRSVQVAGPGSGGAYALDGGEGIPRAGDYPTGESPVVASPLPPSNTPGGDNSALNLEPPGEVIIRSLDHRLGLLRGGSGGGGGGTHCWGSKIFGTAVSCNTSGNVLPFWDHSAAGGGGGGGAFQGVSGRNVLVAGIVDAGGGNGGSALGINAPVGDCKDGSIYSNPDYPGQPESIQSCGANASPGGGGSGGSLKLQGQGITLAALPGRLSVAGGIGGGGVGGSTGGDGSPGLVRLEVVGFSGDQGTEAAVFAPRIEPYLPADMGFNTPFDSAAILSVGEFTVQRIRPDSFSASMSCWMKPEGNFFGLDFAADDTVDPDDPDGKNWNMDIIYDDNGTERMFPYRGLPAGDPNFPLGSVDFETFLGDNQINHDLPAGQGSLVSVRFQGARLSGALEDPCGLELQSPGADIEPGSLTTWVTDPNDLNLFVPKPNMVRFVVVFEQVLRTQGPVQSRIVGITNLRVLVQPN